MICDINIYELYQPITDVNCRLCSCTLPQRIPTDFRLIPIYEELKQILEGLLALNASDAWEELGGSSLIMGVWPQEKDNF